MAKKILNKHDRQNLLTFASRKVDETHDTVARDAAYSACADMVSKLMTDKFPPADMAILDKYGVAEMDRCIFLSAGYGGYDRFTFNPSDPRIPVRPRTHCNRGTPFLLNDEQSAIYEAYKTADKAAADERTKRHSDFKVLIETARTFDELAAIWPAVESLRERICGESRAVSLMNEDVIARIKSDPASKLAA